ncbi:hypothetical protein FJZ26_02750 [Candidatus Parvarchaeota archaeon]|nr:hypothetical protein [Candidatus Parvarchaeota archaeon]
MVFVFSMKMATSRVSDEVGQNATRWAQYQDIFSVAREDLIKGKATDALNLVKSAENAISRNYKNQFDPSKMSLDYISRLLPKPYMDIISAVKTEIGAQLTSARPDYSKALKAIDMLVDTTDLYVSITKIQYNLSSGSGSPMWDAKQLLSTLSTKFFDDKADKDGLFWELSKSAKGAVESLNRGDKDMALKHANVALVLLSDADVSSLIADHVKRPISSIVSGPGTISTVPIRVEVDAELIHKKEYSQAITKEAYDEMKKYAGGLSQQQFNSKLYDAFERAYYDVTHGEGAKKIKVRQSRLTRTARKELSGELENVALVTDMYLSLGTKNARRLLAAKDDDAREQIAKKLGRNFEKLKEKYGELWSQ